MSKDELRGWLARAGKEYTARRAAAKKKVVRWEYATKADRSIEPGYFERGDDIGPGRALRKLPAQPKYGAMSYGLDEAGRCVFERMATLRGGRTERFLNWSDDALEWVYYQDPKNAVAVCRAAPTPRDESFAIRCVGGSGATRRHSLTAPMARS